MSTPEEAAHDANIQWVHCPGCSGDIGVPPHWLAHTVACPKCGAIVSINEVERVLWRPPQAPKANDAATQPTAIVAPAERKSKRLARVSLPVVFGIGLPVALTALFAGFCLGMGADSEDARAQPPAAADIAPQEPLASNSGAKRESRGAYLSFNVEDPGKEISDEPVEDVYAMVSRLNGALERNPDTFGSDVATIERIRLDGASIADSDFARLGSCWNLKELSLNACLLTNAGMREISRLKELEMLSLAGARFQSANLAYLILMPNLRILDLQDADVDEDVVKTLKLILRCSVIR